MSIISKAKVEVFYSQTCPHCPAQKKLAKKFERDEVKVKMTDIARHRGRAKNHNVRATPTTIVSGEEMEGKMGFTGLMREERLEKAIKVAKGEMTMEEFKPDSLMDKLKGIFS